MLSVMLAAAVFLTAADTRREPWLSAVVEPISRTRVEVAERCVGAPDALRSLRRAVAAVESGKPPRQPPRDNRPMLVPQTGWPGSSIGAVAEDLPHA